MERGEPSLVPEWYKGTSRSNFNHFSGSSHSGADEINSRSSSRNRLSFSFCEHDAPRSLSITERTSTSFHKSSSSNGSMAREDIPLRAYSSLSRSHRDRNRDREKDLELCDRNRPLLEDNGFSNNPDSLATNKLEKESSWHSHPMVSGGGGSGLKRPAQFSINNISSGGSSIITGISKSSFERDFPSLGAEEKHVGSDLARVASPGLSTSIHNLPVTASAIIRGDEWTSALAELPPIVGGNDPVVSSALPASPVLKIPSGPSSGLNMAETVGQSPTRVRTLSQLPSDSQKIEELHRLQILKLRPVMPSMPTKNLGLHTAEKTKTKTARTAEISVRSDVYKIFQPGNFQVLNREKNSLSSTKVIPKSIYVSRVTPTPGAIPSASIQPLKGSMNPKIKLDGKNGASITKKLPSQLQNRSDFFNSLRKKTSSAQQHSNASNVSSSDASSFILEKTGVKFSVGSPPNRNNGFHCSAEEEENESCSAGDCDAFEETEKLAPDEEEEAFLRSLGWEENAGVEALTHEEIESFLSVYKMRRPASKLNI